MSSIDDGTASIVMQPVRFKLLQVLLGSQEPMYIDQLANVVGESPRLVSHHLDKLEDLGLVESKFQIVERKGSSRGVAGRFFKPTSKLAKVFADIASVSVPHSRGSENG
ncbi:MAG: winged helix-turn-helix domain-containing protein [Nitrososphaerales archaeon]|jgi:DNA-binding transcriptional ArsR family regulator